MKRLILMFLACTVGFPIWAGGWKDVGYTISFDQIIMQVMDVGIALLLWILAAGLIVTIVLVTMWFFRSVWRGGESNDIDEDK